MCEKIWTLPLQVNDESHHGRSSISLNSPMQLRSRPSEICHNTAAGNWSSRQVLSPTNRFDILAATRTFVQSSLSGLLDQAVKPPGYIWCGVVHVVRVGACSNAHFLSFTITGFRDIGRNCALMSIADMTYIPLIEPE
jgi:hypothetical protein